MRTLRRESDGAGEGLAARAWRIASERATVELVAQSRRRGLPLRGQLLLI